MWVLYCIYFMHISHALILLNKMVLLRESINTLLKVVFPCFISQIFLLLIGVMPLVLPLIWLIGFPFQCWLLRVLGNCYFILFLLLSSLKTFGCACFPLLKPYTYHKLQPKSTQCIFLGYPPLSKGYICFDPHSHKIYITPHVIFNESNFPTVPTGHSDSSCSSSSVHLPLDLWISKILSSSSPSSFSSVSDALPSVLSSFPVSHQSSDVSITSTDVPLPSSSSITSSGPTASLSHAEIFDQLSSPLPPSTSSSLPNTHPMLSRSKHGIFKPKA